VKGVSGFKYETIGDFEKLRVELRKIEREQQFPVTKKKRSRKAVYAQQNVAEAANKDSETSELKYLVCLFVYSHTSNFSAIWWLSPLPVTGLQI
jgi:hypothetical protein